MNNIYSEASELSVINNITKKLEDRIVDDMNLLKGLKIDFEIFFKYVFIDCCGCLDKECNILELRETRLNNILRYSKVYSSDKLSLDELDVVSKIVCNNIIIDVGIIVKELYNNVDSVSKSRIALAIKFIELFQLSGLIEKRQDMYFILNSNMRLKWNNIKRISIENVKVFKKFNNSLIMKLTKIYTGNDDELSDLDLLLMIKSLFWYFRKALVDSIISDIIRLDNLNVKAMSVGSTKLTSDYDITLDGTYKGNSKIIKRYDKFIEILFVDDSESVFDTNVYGVSFIKDMSRDIVITPDETSYGKIVDKSNKMIMDAFDREHLKCGKFSYILSEEKDFIISQHIWAFIKLLLRLNKVHEQDEELFGMFLDDLSKRFNENRYYNAAVNFVNKYDSNMEYYQRTVNDVNRFLEKSKRDDENSKYLVSNFISYVNYNGSETYLTNGAFLDVVVNNQMCKKKVEDMIKLDFNSYLDSFIENLSDLMTHYHKVKYLDRARDAFNNMLELGKGFDSMLSCDVLIKNFNAGLCEKIYLSEYINKILLAIGKLQKECSRDILNCQNFIMIYYTLYCIIIVFKRYVEWSNISLDELDKGIKRFEKLEFKSFRIPIESKITENV